MLHASRSSYSAGTVPPTWDQARAAAHAAGRMLPSERIALSAADGRILNEAVVAATCLPPFRMSTMDGWAVGGSGPWRIVGRNLAGSLPERPLAAGDAVTIATGAAVPEGTRAVLPSEDGTVTARGWLRGEVAEGQCLRPAGEEAGAGAVLVPAGTRMTPAHLGLAAAGGADTVVVVRRPTARVLIGGDELLHSGPAGGGRVRDSLGPQLPAWLSRLGVDAVAVTRVADTLEDHVTALKACQDVDLVVTTGGTAAGPADFLRTAVAVTGGDVIVGSVAVRPGHPMFLARWHGERGDGQRGQREGDPRGDGWRWLLALPGNPQSAVVALITLGEPLLAALAGQAPRQLDMVSLTSPVSAPPEETRLIAARLREGRATPVPHVGSGMLRGLAAADGFAVITPGGLPEGAPVQWLSLPGQMPASST